jgi:cytochrome c oxidase assembly factor CtaG
VTDLNPSAASLLFQLRFDPLVWLVWGLAVGLYFWRFALVRRDAPARSAWPLWRAVCFGAGALVALVALQSNAVSYVLNSMALYMGRLMLLAELAPPLLILGLPKGLMTLRPGSVLRRLLTFLLDPLVALALWGTIIIFWNLPGGMNASLVSATAAGLLPALYLLLRPLPELVRLGTFGRGMIGLLAALPMMVVGAVWLYSDRVLYSPYVGAPCLWNLTPLGNQSVSGWIMMIADIPALGLALVQIMGGLIQLADGDGLPKAALEGELSETPEQG